MIVIGYGSNVSMDELKAWLDVDSDCDFETAVEMCEQLGSNSENGTEPKLVFHFNEHNDTVFITEEKLFSMRTKMESFMSVNHGSISSKRLESIAKAMNVPIGICLFVTGSEHDEVPVEGAVDMLDEIEAGLTQIHDEQSHESHDEESDEEEDACDEEEHACDEDDIEEDESESQTQVPAFTPQKPFFEIAT